METTATLAGDKEETIHPVSGSASQPIERETSGHSSAAPAEPKLERALSVDRPEHLEILLSNPPQWFLSPQWLPLLSGGAWLGVSAILSQVGGWHSLAESYPVPKDFALTLPNRFRMKSIQLREHSLIPVSYSNCITLGVTSRGLYLAPMFMFRFMHPPLLIPWPEIIDWDEGGLLWFRWVEVETRSGGARIRLPWVVADLARSQWLQARKVAAA